MTPPNFGGGGGRYLVSSDSVADGEPGTDRVCCAFAGRTRSNEKTPKTTTAAPLKARPYLEIGFISYLLRVGSDKNSDFPEEGTA
jgi:hypothetical protein